MFGIVEWEIFVKDYRSGSLLCDDRAQGMSLTVGHSWTLACQMSFRNVEALQDAWGR